MEKKKIIARNITTEEMKNQQDMCSKRQRDQFETETVLTEFESSVDWSIAVGVTQT